MGSGHWSIVTNTHKRLALMILQKLARSREGYNEDGGISIKGNELEPVTVEMLQENKNTETNLPVPELGQISVPRGQVTLVGLLGFGAMLETA